GRRHCHGLPLPRHFRRPGAARPFEPAVPAGALGHPGPRGADRLAPKRQQQEEESWCGARRLDHTTTPPLFLCFSASSGLISYFASTLILTGLLVSFTLPKPSLSGLTPSGVGLVPVVNVAVSVYSPGSVQ